MKTGAIEHRPTAQVCNASVKLRCATHYSCTTGVGRPVSVNLTLIPNMIDENYCRAPLKKATRPWAAGKDYEK